jgi:hypothetical protein
MSHDASFARARRAAITSQIQAETDVDEAMIALTPSTRHVRGFAVTRKLGDITKLTELPSTKTGALRRGRRWVAPAFSATAPASSPYGS